MKIRSYDPKKEPRISSAQVKSQFQSRPFAVQAKPQAQETPDLQTQLESAQRFGHNFANIPIQNPGSLTPSRIQPKLTIGAPGDKYEQEADKTAAEVVQQLHSPVPSDERELSQPESEFVQRMKAGTVQNSNLIYQQGIPNRKNKLMRKLDVCALQREVMPEEDKELQMKPTLQLQSSEGGMSASSDLETTIQQARGSGQPLAQSIREPMEQAFGVDFSGVKIHTDAQSDQLNQSIQAKAFTTGQDVFFRQGMYEPGSRGGQELLAHELTHVVQQSGSGNRTVQRRFNFNIFHREKSRNTAKDTNFKTREKDTNFKTREIENPKDQQKRVLQYLSGLLAQEDAINWAKNTVDLIPSTDPSLALYSVDNPKLDNLVPKAMDLALRWGMSMEGYLLEELEAVFSYVDSLEQASIDLAIGVTQTDVQPIFSSNAVRPDVPNHMTAINVIDRKSELPLDLHSEYEKCISRLQDILIKVQQLKTKVRDLREKNTAHAKGGKGRNGKDNYGLAPSTNHEQEENYLFSPPIDKEGAYKQTPARRNSPSKVPIDKEGAYKQTPARRNSPSSDDDSAFMLQGAVVSNQGLTISQELLNAIRKDILTSGQASKWADNHEIQAIAEALNVQIEIHDARGVFGSSGQLHHLQYNGRDHYSACVLDGGGEKTIRGQNYKLVRVPGNGDCFYNALLKSMSSFGDVSMTVSDLRNLVNTKLTDQEIADVAIPLITDYTPTKLGLGANFIALMQSRKTHYR